MISILNVIVYALIVLIALVLVVLILVQPSKDGGLGAAFGGVGENVFGAHAMDHLSKITVWLISAFFVLALALTVLNRFENENESLMDGATVETKESAEKEEVAPNMGESDSETNGDKTGEESNGTEGK